MRKKTLRRQLKQIFDHELKRSCFLSKNKIKTLSGNYLSPSSVPHLSSKLKGEFNCLHIDDYLLKKDIDFLNKNEKFKGLIENGYYNPYKPYQLSKYFIKTESFNELDVIYKFIKYTDLKRNIVILGEKGSGKTAYQNCWLNENNRKLENHKIFWVRCDGHKLYKLWLEHQDEIDKANKNEENIPITVQNLVDIDEYLHIQLLYVFAKYCLKEDRPFIKNIIGSMKKDNPAVNLPTKNPSPLPNKANLYQEIINKRKIILKEEAGENKEDYSYAFDKVMKLSLDTQQRDKKKWIAISKALQKYLKKKGYAILKIVDGADNVHINDERSAIYYKHMIKNTSKFLRYRPESNEINIIVMRDRTYIDSCHHPIQSDTKDYTRTYEIRHTAGDFKKIINKRYEFAKGNIFNEGELFDDIVLEAIHNISKGINEMHHNNARAFLYNKMSLIGQVYYRIKQLDNPNIKNINITHHIKTLEHRNRFLNGRLYLNTKDQWHILNSELGLCCMNIFFFNIDDYPISSPKNWYGLCKTRLLQLLEINNKIKQEDLIEYCHLYFEYPVDLITTAIDDLRAFGMIDSNYNKSIYFTLSKKGEKHLNISYSDLDTVYYFALDTPLPEKFIKSGMIATHNNKFRRRTNYPSAAITTITSFILFLLCINRLERIKHTNNVKKYGLHKIINYKEVILPLHQKDNYLQILLKGRQLINQSDTVDINKINSYLKKIQLIRKTSTIK